MPSTPPVPAPRSGSTARPSPGFGAGARTLPAAAAFLARRPRLWPAAAIPVLLLVVLSVAGLAIALIWIRPLVETWIPDGSTAIGRIASELSVWAATVVAAAIGLVIALGATPPLSAPALEHLVAARERALAVPARPPAGFWSEIWCGLRAQALAWTVAAPLLLSLWVLDLLVPLAVVVTVPVKAIVLSLSIAWNLFDYPLTLRGIPMGTRLALLRAHPRAVLGYGLSVSVLFWLPCASVLLLPVAVLAATELVWMLDPPPTVSALSERTR